MESSKLKQFSQKQLIEMEVKPQKAEQAAKSLTKEELWLSGDICSD